jgi:predicted MPP superfamily phosphohydrolase
MKRRSHYILLFFIFLSLFFIQSGFVFRSIDGQWILRGDTSKFDDGPYVFLKGKKITEKRIVAGELQSVTRKSNEERLKFKTEQDVFEGVSKIAALSDVHGQFDLMIQLLRANKLIDDKDQWSFGNGHLVMVGDVFDRGEDVIEILWFLFNLESQAEAAGGQVHYLLGNHEYMVLQNDLRYLHPNHLKAAELMGTTYDQLFSEETQLGRWLRSKPTILKIGDNVFLHGGLSDSFLSDWKDIPKANDEFRKTIDMPMDSIRVHPILAKYAGSDCPIWYRGYFDGSMSSEQIDAQLNLLDAKRIIVGHTSQKEVIQLYDGRIYCVDSSIKNGKYGELLFIEGEKVSRGTLNGERLGFDK